MSSRLAPTQQRHVVRFLLHEPRLVMLGRHVQQQDPDAIVVTGKSS